MKKLAWPINNPSQQKLHFRRLLRHPCDNTGKVEPGGRGHTALLSGTFVGGQTCLVKAVQPFGISPANFIFFHWAVFGCQFL